MGILSWIVERGLRGMVNKEVITGPGNGWENVLGGTTNWTDASDIWPRLSDAQRSAHYRKQSIVFACVRLICSAMHAAPLQIGEDRGDGFKEIPSHPVIGLLNRPNEWLSAAEFMEYHIAHLLLTGKSYIWEWRDPRGQVAELWPIPTHWVKVVPLGEIQGNAAQRQNEDRRFISHYNVKTPGASKPIPVPSQDMTFARFIDPNNFLGGISPLEAASRDVHLEYERTDYMAEMLDNLKVPGMVLSSEEPMHDEQRELLKSALSRMLGRGKRGSPLVLSGKGAKLEMQAPLKDLDWPGLSSMNESHICAVYGVPPLMVHARVAQENSPLSSPSLNAAERMFYRTTMSNLWLHNASALKRGLILNEGYDESLILRHDTSNVPALQEDKKEIAVMCSESVKGGFMMVNEARERMGLEPDDKLDGTYLIPMGMTHYKPGEEQQIKSEDDDQDHSEDDEWDNDENNTDEDADTDNGTQEDDTDGDE